MSAHTGMPWIEQDMRGCCNDRITADDGEGTIICEFPYGLDANSAFIVRACNSHDALVAALKAAAQVGEIKFRKCVLSAQVADQIAAALAAAGGRRMNPDINLELAQAADDYLRNGGDIARARLWAALAAFYKSRAV